MTDHYFELCVIIDSLFLVCEYWDVRLCFLYMCVLCRMCICSYICISVYILLSGLSYTQHFVQNEVAIYCSDEQGNLCMYVHMCY